MDYHILDIIVIALVTVLGLKGLFHGLVKEVFGLIGLVGGVFLASRFADETGAWVSSLLPFIESESVGKLAGFAAGFLLFWVFMVSVGGIITKLVQKSGLGVVDKLGGAVVGGAKIFLIFAIVAYALGSIEFIKKRTDIVFEGSTLYPLLYDTGSYIMKLDQNEAMEQVASAKQEATKSVEIITDDIIKEAVESTINQGSKTKEEINDEIKRKIEEAVKNLEKKGEI